MSITGFNSYSRVNWKNGPSGGTPWNADNLNIMDKGIKDNNDMIKQLINEQNKITDDTTSAKYKLGINNGNMYYEEVDD